MDESLIIETWDVFREYLPEKHKETAANHYVQYLRSKDVSVSSLEDIMGNDPFLDMAIDLLINNEAEDDFSDDDESEEEDEDY